MTDKELLELAAKAAGYELHWSFNAPDAVEELPYINGWTRWNPLTDDGDALRLAVKLRLDIQVNEASVLVSWLCSEFESTGPLYEYPKMDQDDLGDLKYVGHDAATRRVIVRAAAEIGKKLP